MGFLTKVVNWIKRFASRLNLAMGAYVFDYRTDKHQLAVYHCIVRLCDSPHKGQVTRKMFLFYDVIMQVAT